MAFLLPFHCVHSIPDVGQRFKPFLYRIDGRTASYSTYSHWSSEDFAIATCFQTTTATPHSWCRYGGDSTLQWRRNELKVGRKADEVFWSFPSTFSAAQVQLVVLVERFRDGQCSLVSFLFAVLLLTVPPWPAICKSGGRKYGTGYNA